jgi:hypothetical protein
LTELVATSYVDFLAPEKGSQYAYSSLQLQVTGEGPPKAQVPASRLRPEIHTTVEGVKAQQTTNREMVLHLTRQNLNYKKKNLRGGVLERVTSLCYFLSVVVIYFW